MRIINFELNSRLANEIEPLTAAIGFFDGLHRGHMQLVRETIKQAKINKTMSGLITFSPSPASVLANKPEILITTIEERVKLAKKAGIDVLIILRFSKELSQLEPIEFYEKIIKNLEIKHLVCGEDFKFGYRGSGNTETLRQIKDLGLTVIEDYEFDDIRISTTRVKENLSKGNIELVNEMLGYEYELNGFVMHGRKKGRTIGFPTLNLLIEESKYIPKSGVYIAISVIDGLNYISTLNIGHNPTINTVKDTSIESYVHNYQRDTYGSKVTFKLIKRIRDEEKFPNVDKLISQMHLDIENTEKYFDINKRRAFNIGTL